MGIVFIIIILILLIGDLTKIGSKSNKEGLCTGCGNKVEEKYIRVNEHGLIQPLCYCTEQCKIDYLEEDRKKYAEIDLIETTFG